MKERLYIDGVLQPKVSPALVKRAIKRGRRVVIVDGGNVAVELTKAVLK